MFGNPIGYVNIKDIDVRHMKLLQARVDAKAERLGVIAMIIDFVGDIGVS